MEPVTRNGFGCDAAWADDFHHALRVLLTGEREGYYEDFGDVWQLAKAFRAPHVHDGTWSGVRGRVFGASSGHLPPEAFVVFSQDHDQVGNRAIGDRMPPECRSLAAFAVLLSPFVPMLFMGEEYGEDAEFQFFTDHIDEEIAVATREGRRREFAGFAGFAAEDVPDPQDPATFARSKLTRREQPGIREHYAELLRLRRELGHAPVEDVAFDEQQRWLVVTRAGVELAMNFARDEREVPVRSGTVTLAPLSGRVVR
jgi:maltooligosyltrehalose trehalohydrolase